MTFCSQNRYATNYATFRSLIKAKSFILGLSRLERLTLRLSSVHSNQLSYKPKRKLVVSHFLAFLNENLKDS